MDFSINSGIGSFASRSNSVRNERLLVEADRLFSVGWLIKRLLTELQTMISPEAVSAPHLFFYSLRQEAERWFVWSMLGAHQKSLADVKALYQMFPQKEQFLAKLKEVREELIQDFSKLLISKRWDQLRDDDRSWRDFARVMFNLENSNPSATKDFFPLVDYICVATDVLLGHSNLYFLDATDADKTELQAFLRNGVSTPDLSSITIRAELKTMLKGEWFKMFCADKNRFTVAWREKFVEDLMDSEYGQKIVIEWETRSLIIKGGIIGCLKEAGVFIDEASALKIARTILFPIPIQKSENREEEALKLKKSKTLSSYIGKGRRQEFYYWVKEYVG